MPFVPIGPASSHEQVFSRSSTAGNRSSPGKDWYTEEYGPFQSTKLMSSAMKVGSKGSKVKYSWGWWMPTRGYSRTATLVTLMGGTNLSYNKSLFDEATRFYEERGFPHFTGPTSPVGSFTPPDKEGYIVGRLPVLDSNTRSRLITECILKVGDRKANYGEALAEGRQTLNHIAKTSITLVRALIALRRGRFKDFARALGVSSRKGWVSKLTASRWLEYQYAWLPLMGDIFDSYNLLRDGIDRKSNIIRGVRQLTFTEDYIRSTPYATLSGTLTLTHNCKLWYRLKNSTADSFYRTGLINPFEVAWAVVPFSFVVDWFLPVANVLEAYSALQGLTYVDGCFSSIVKVEAEGPHTGTYNNYPYSQTDFVWRLSHFGFRRMKIPTAPDPGLYVKSPFTSTHVISALALLRQLRG